VVFRWWKGAAGIQLDVVELPVGSPRSRRSTPANWSRNRGGTLWLRWRRNAEAWRRRRGTVAMARGHGGIYRALRSSRTLARTPRTGGGHAMSAMDTGVPGPLMGSSGLAAGPGDGAGLGLGRTGPRPENTRGGEGVEQRSPGCKTKLPNDGLKQKQAKSGEKKNPSFIFRIIFSVKRIL
jgi:hypothetical protein